MHSPSKGWICSRQKDFEFCICNSPNLCYRVFIPAVESDSKPEVVCVTGLPARTAPTFVPFFYLGAGALSQDPLISSAPLRYCGPDLVIAATHLAGLSSPLTSIQSLLPMSNSLFFWFITPGSLAPAFIASNFLHEAHTCSINVYPEPGAAAPCPSECPVSPGGNGLQPRLVFQKRSFPLFFGVFSITVMESTKFAEARVQRRIET
jgi:hypothetical protein